MENSNLLLDFWINVTVERVKRHVHPESMEDFVKKYYDLSVSEHTSNQFLAHKNIGHDEAVDELPF